MFDIVKISCDERVVEMKDLVSNFICGVLENRITNDTVLNVLHLAGFTDADTISVDIHKVEGMESQQDGIVGTGKYYQVNMNSGLVVLCQTKVLLMATYWLDGIWKYISDNHAIDHKVLEGSVMDFIVNSVPLNPIVLTELGEALVEHYPQGVGIRVVHKRDKDMISGVHAICNFQFEIRQVSKSHKALNCRGCMLRVVIPLSVETFGQLREYLSEFQN